MSADRIAGRLALVTGAGRGLGAAIARALARRGARLIVCDIDAASLDRIADELGAVHRAVVDVADSGAVQALADRVHAEHGPLGVLVNNAGVVAAAPALEMPVADWDWMLDVNLRGVLYGCRAFGPAMVAAPERGHIVNIASAAAFGGLPVMSGYAVSKAAVLAWSESLRAEIPRRALGISVICPGFVPTGLVESGRFAGDGGGGLQAIARRVLDRPGRSPDAVARAVVAAIERDRFLVPIYAEGWLGLAGRGLPSRLRIALVGRIVRAIIGRRAP